MLYLFLAIIAASTYSILFKLFACREIDSLQAIAFNYLTAALLGVVLSIGTISEGVVLTAGEWGMSVVMGVMFFTAFVLMARSTAKVGVSVTTVAARVALVIPVVGSYLLLPNQIEPRWGAIVVILLALVMVIWQQSPQTTSTERKGRVVGLLLPLGVFLLFGTNNFCLKWLQNGMSAEGGAEQLSAAIFLFAALAGGVYYFATTRQRAFSWKAMVGGVALGVANFFTTYCMILGLAELPSGLFFPVYHVSIVALVTLLGVFIFGERLSKMQIVGLGIAIVGIVAFFV